jgi:hypothetical protein
MYLEEYARYTADGNGPFYYSRTGSVPDIVGKTDAGGIELGWMGISYMTNVNNDDGWR